MSSQPLLATAIQPIAKTRRPWALETMLLAGLNVVVIAAMWLRHGGPALLVDATGVVTATGQLSGLFAAYIALLQVILMARTPWLDQLFGMTKLAAWHRVLGFTTLGLLLVHIVLSPLGLALASDSSWLDEVMSLVSSVPFMLMALVSGVLFVAVAVTSVRAARRRFSYETWYWIHVYAYLAVILGFGHQLVAGTDFVSDPLARAYWVGLYVAAAAILVVFRFGQPVLLAWRHRLRVAKVVTEGPGVVSVYVTGRDLHRLSAQAGQYFNWRFLTRDGWWRAHPFSLSAAPNGRWLRLTVKDLGDWSRRLASMAVGTRLMVEGPYGILTNTRRHTPKVALIAGGIGITPLRALLEEQATIGEDVVLIYRASRMEDLVFRTEIDKLARARHVRVHYLVGSHTPFPSHTDMSPSNLSALVSDIATRDVYLCGPVPMMTSARAALRKLGVPSRQIHFESFAY